MTYLDMIKYLRKLHIFTWSKITYIKPRWKLESDMQARAINVKRDDYIDSGGVRC